MVTKRSINKVIHQLWVGDLDPPEHLMRDWQMNGWEYRLWTERNMPKLKNQRVFDYYYNNGDFAGASDVFRYEILCDIGGLYVDADTKRLRAIPDELLDTTMLAGYAHQSFDQPFRVATSVLGFTPNHPVLQEVIKRLGELTELEPGWNTVGATLLTQVIIDMEPKDINIMPAWVFYPHNSKGVLHPRHKEAITEHLWGSRGDVY